MLAVKGRTESTLAMVVDSYSGYLRQHQCLSSPLHQLLRSLVCASVGTRRGESVPPTTTSGPAPFERSDPGFVTEIACSGLLCRICGAHGAPSSLSLSQRLLSNGTAKASIAIGAGGPELLGSEARG